MQVKNEISMSPFWNLSRLHHFNKMMLSDQQGEGRKFWRNSLPLFLFKSFGWRPYGSTKGNTWSMAVVLLLIFCSSFCLCLKHLLECHLYVKWNTWTSFVFYINVKGSQAKEPAEGPDVCFCIKRITGTRQAPGMEKVSQCTVMFYNFCWLQYFEFLIIRKLIVNLRFPYL